MWWNNYDRTIGGLGRDVLIGSVTRVMYINADIYYHEFGPMKLIDLRAQIYKLKD
jgi:hypothetical protein